jgi:AGZA family xanthine/uracil permease-like MFS transporter
MAAIIVEGLLVTILVLTNLREAVLNAIPLSLKFAIAVGIGLFIAFIGLKNAGIVVPDPVTYVKLGDFTQGPVLLAAFGLALTLALVARGIRGGSSPGWPASSLVWCRSPDRSPPSTSIPRR